MTNPKRSPPKVSSQETDQLQNYQDDERLLFGDPPKINHSNFTSSLLSSPDMNQTKAGTIHNETSPEDKCQNDTTMHDISGIEMKDDEDVE